MRAIIISLLLCATSFARSFTIIDIICGPKTETPPVGKFINLHGKKFTHNVPTIKIDLDNLTPNYVIWIKIYRGAMNPKPWTWSEVDTDKWMMNGKDTKGNMFVQDPNPYFQKGVYTVELWIASSMGTYRMDYATISVDRSKLAANGFISTIQD